MDWDFEFAKLENFTIRICYQLMRHWRHWLVTGENQSTKVLRLLQDMDKARLQLGHGELEYLIWACVHEEHCVVTEELYFRIRGMDVQVNLAVCNHVIWLMGKARKLWAALEIYEDLLDKGPKPNNRSRDLVVSQFNVLLTAARERGIWRWEVRLLNKMEEKGLKPREWNLVLVACSKAAETSATVEIFKRMVEQGEKPTQISYGHCSVLLRKGGSMMRPFRSGNIWQKWELSQTCMPTQLWCRFMPARGNLMLWIPSSWKWLVLALSQLWSHSMQ